MHAARKPILNLNLMWYSPPYGITRVYVDLLGFLFTFGLIRLKRVLRSTLEWGLHMFSDSAKTRFIMIRPASIFRFWMRSTSYKLCLHPSFRKWFISHFGHKLFRSHSSKSRMPPARYATSCLSQRTADGFIKCFTLKCKFCQLFNLEVTRLFFPYGLSEDSPNLNNSRVEICC